jgi:predicted nucleic acid-binding protein
VQKFEILAEMIKVTETITACRDSKDDKFLSLAVTANVVALISGDNDLLILNPFKNISTGSVLSISIITPAEFLKNF